MSSIFLDAGDSTVSALETELEAELETALHEAHRLGADANQVFCLSVEDFSAFLGARAHSVQTLRVLAVKDLYLACACSLGNPQAIDCFVQRMVPEISMAIHKMAVPASIAEEIKQQILTQLMVPNAQGTCGIESYRGQGAMFAWIHVITTRRALRELSLSKRDVPIDDEQILVAITPTPELGYMKEMYRQAFRTAFSHALTELDESERTLLRQHYIHELSIDKLSVLHKIHRATAARRLAKSREQLLSSTRRQLLRQLRVDTDELDSIMRLITSNLDASMNGLLS